MPKQIDRLNPTTLLNRVKRNLGIKSFILPFTDEELLDILYSESLPTFSVYFPRYFRYRVCLDSLKAQDGPDGFNKRYFLNLNDFKDIQIIDIEEVTPVELPLEYFHDMNTMGGLDAFGMVTELYETAVIESMLSVPIITRFEPPNIISIDNFAYVHRGEVEIKFLISHSNDLSTIQYAQRDLIYELYKYDVQIALYNELKHYDKIDTQFGQIDLKIDDWQDALGRREDLIKQWESTFIMYREKTIFKG